MWSSSSSSSWTVVKLLENATGSLHSHLRHRRVVIVITSGVLQRVLRGSLISVAKSSTRQHDYVGLNQKVTGSPPITVHYTQTLTVHRPPLHLLLRPRIVRPLWSVCGCCTRAGKSRRCPRIYTRPSAWPSVSGFRFSPVHMGHKSVFIALESNQAEPQKD